MISNEENQWLWMVAHLSGNGTPEDERKLTEWRNGSRQNELLFREVEKIWESSGKKISLANPSTDKEWEKLHQRITSGHQAHFISTSYYWMGAAACLVLFLIYGIYSYRLRNDTAIPMYKSIVAIDQVKTFYLPDSSRIWLNVGSELIYMNSFDKSDRTVNLKGEAYFHVLRDAAQPFIINTKNGAVAVVGTSFNMKDDQMLTVVVEEGIVRLSSKPGKDQQLELTQGERGEASELGLKEMKNEDPLFSAWRNKNNPLYDNEVGQPLQFLKQKYSWKEGSLNQTVVDGYLISNATLAVYEKVTLKISYQRPNRKMIVTQFTVDQRIYPGQKINYHKRLLDFFVKNPKVTVEIESAQPVTR